jgi:outer membrane protein
MALAIAALLFAMPASAVTLVEALQSAYTNNPTLNAARAALRATDEGVPQALAGYRPTISASGSASVGSANGNGTWSHGVGLSIEQPIFTGYRTANGVKIAETAVLAQREALRKSEQDTLLAAVNAFMNLVQAQAVLNLRKQNVDFLNQQVRAAKDRLNVGEGTRTDVAQTNARLAAGQSDYNAAAASLNAAVAVYQQVIGAMPKTLGHADGVDRKVPRTLQASLDTAMANHPSVLIANYNIDIADYNVKVQEGALLPSASLTGSLSHSNSSSSGVTNSASLMAGVKIPIFSGGELASKVRQAKETLSQRRIEHDVARDAVRQGVISAWGLLDAARAQITAANAQVSAQQLVLSGVIEEQKVGQATTLDVLNAQQELLNAKVAQVSAQHDRVVAAYSLMAATGLLSAEKLGLKVSRYDPTAHYGQVRNLLGGMKTPDGR